MTHVLLATASVHTTAAAADYLDGRLDADDAVTVLTVDEPDLADRDAGDTANVARSRLLPATVDVHERDGDPAAEIRAALSERDVDQLLLGPRHGDPETADEDRLGSTARAVLGSVDVLVVVLPAPDV